MKRQDQIILGRLIGTASGWDASDDYAFVLYDFEPLYGVNLPRGTINFDFIKGHISTFDEVGNESVGLDMISALFALPMVKP